ncbi:MAG: site-specific integrase, partial [Acidobacteriota bacterium]|nr:site-specific integrase [Acidobacteriota bacterium]
RRERGGRSDRRGLAEDPEGPSASAGVAVRGRSRGAGGGRDVGAGPAVKAAISFTALTAVRSGEARGERWGEVDLEAREWRVPASRMKAGAEHRVPLSDAAVAVLEGMKAHSDGAADSLIFPGVGGRRLNSDTLIKALRRATGTDADVHGFRSSFRTWAAERSGATRNVAELALAHVVGGAVERSYARSDLFDQRRVLMDGWAAFVTGAAATR